MKKMLLALSLMVALDVHAAVFHLKNVVLSTLPTNSHPVMETWGSLTGYVKFEGPFQAASCDAPCGGGIDVNTPKTQMNWDIKVRDLNGNVVDRFTPSNTFGYQQSAGPTSSDAKYITTFGFHTKNPDPNDSRGVALTFLAGIGTELEQAIVPLGAYDRTVLTGLTIKESGAYNEPGVTRFTPDGVVICCADVRKVHPIIGGYLQVNNNPPSAPVPEQQAWAMFAAGLLVASVRFISR